MRAIVIAALLGYASATHHHHHHQQHLAQQSLSLETMTGEELTKEYRKVLKNGLQSESEQKSASSKKAEKCAKELNTIEK